MNKNNIPKLRFKEFADEWQEETFFDIFSSILDFRGRTPLKLGMNWGGKIPSLSALNVKMGYIDFSLDPHMGSEELYNRWMNQGDLAKGDILFTMEAPLGNVALVPNDDKYILSQRVVAFKVDHSTDNVFVYQLMCSNDFQRIIKNLSTGSTAKGINQRSLKKVRIKTPAKKEQGKIAGFLTAVDEKMNKLEEKKKRFEKYKKGVMQAIFSQEIRFKKPDGSKYPDWEEKKLGGMTKIYDGTHQTPDYKFSGVPFYSVEHITSDNFDDTKYIAEEIYAIESQRVKIEKGDILMTRIGDIGSSKLMSWEVRAAFYVSLALIKKSNSFNSIYLDQFIKTDKFQHELWQRTIHVAFPKKINLGEIGECLVDVPAAEEQEKIAEFLTALDEKVELINKQLERVKLFKKSLLQQMFV